MWVEYICDNGHNFISDQESSKCFYCYGRLAYYAFVDMRMINFANPSLGGNPKKIISEKEIQKFDYKGNSYWEKEFIWFPNSDDWRVF